MAGSAAVIVFISALSAHESMSTPMTLPAQVLLPFLYEFRTDGVLEESGSIDASTSPYWWVNSGGYLFLQGGLGRTLHGRLPAESKWRKIYGTVNPGETDQGERPQNVFRLLTRTAWQDVSEAASFRVTHYEASPDIHRGASNGILLFQRYLDSDNLYYAGLRVDGSAIIKKKARGIYYTLAEKKALPGTYARETSPNLLPLGTWIRLKMEVRNVDATRVSIVLYGDVGRTGTWTKLAEATDDGASFGGRAHFDAGHGGIRTDFMDVEFDDFLLERIPAAR